MVPLDWIDEYVARLREFVFVREEDNLLIKVPNEAYKLNKSGVVILKRLLDGEPVAQIWRSFGGTAQVQNDLQDFFMGLKQVLEKTIDESRLPSSVVARPFQLGFNALPVLSEIALTYRCNLECKFCYAAQYPNADSSTLDTDAFKRVLRVIRHEAKIPSVSFTGGEPTLCGELPDLVRFARHDLSMRVNLITNATLIDADLAGNLRESGLSSAQVSIESPDPEVHDALTGQAGSFDKSVQGLVALRDTGIHVHTNTTINRFNARSLTRMPAFVRQLGMARFSMNLIIPMRRGNEINLSYSEVATLIPAIQQEARKQQVEFMWYSPTPICIFNPIQYHLGNKGCAACDGLLSISPTGDVLPCSSWNESVGNILAEEFRAVWQSVRATRLRAKAAAPGECTGCEHFALCQGACPLYWRQFDTSEIDCGRKRHALAGG